MENKYKYRFKTEKELFDEFGEYWMEDVSMNVDGFMNYLLGSDIIPNRSSINKYGDVVRGFNIQNECPNYNVNRRWGICPNLITRKQLTPFYMLTKEERQKRFIYE